MASESTVLKLTKLSGQVVDLAVSGGTTTCFVQSRPIQIHPRGRECYIDGIRFEVTEEADLTNAYFRVGWKDKLDDATNWYVDPIANSDQFSLADANSVYDIRIEARFVIFEVYDNQVAASWKMSAIELYGKPTAGRRN